MSVTAGTVRDASPAHTRQVGWPLTCTTGSSKSRSECLTQAKAAEPYRVQACAWGSVIVQSRGWPTPLGLAVFVTRAVTRANRRRIPRLRVVNVVRLRRRYSGVRFPEPRVHGRRQCNLGCPRVFTGAPASGLSGLQHRWLRYTPISRMGSLALRAPRACHRPFHPLTPLTNQREQTNVTPMKTIWLASPGSPSARATLRSDTWDDYTYKTTAIVTLRVDRDTEFVLGAAKFIYRNQPDRTRSWDNIPETFVSLDENWASLGQDPDYYEQLATLNPILRKRYLTAVRDAAWDPAIEAAFEHDDAWSTSVLRFSQASEALRRGKELFQTPTEARSRIEPTTLHFQLPLADRPGLLDLKFHFGSTNDEPSPISAIIGYNGTGKTTALARIARIAHVDSTQQSEPSFVQANGKLLSPQPKISSVLMISFSAFDNFTLPSEMTTNVEDAVKDGADDYFGYSYCGLRVRGESESEYLLKSSRQMKTELEKNYMRSTHPSRSQYLNIALEELAMEPSAEQLGHPENLSDITARYNSLSSGHKIVLSSVLHLCGRLHRRTLVLIDVPESHLHPSLLSAFLRILRRLLVESDSRAIIATHSPIVLQELPSRSVLILNRSFGITTASAPDVETFAESLERITAQVFRVDASRSDYHETLRELADNYTHEQIEEMYPLGLPARAWSYIQARTARSRR